MKVVTIIENNAITGVKYGTVEVPDTVISTPKDAILSATQQIKNIKKSRIANIRKNNTKNK